MRRFECSVCGYIYDEAVGLPEKGLAPGTKWEDLPEDFVCPLCSAPKTVFKPLGETAAPQPAIKRNNPVVNGDSAHGDIGDLSAGEIAAICSSLAKGCEKQRLIEEMEAYNTLADYFKTKGMAQGVTLADTAVMLNEDIAKGFAAAKAAAQADGDRGALRSLVWSEKVSIMLQSLLDRFANEGDDMLSNIKIFVCDICGFIMLGGTAPEICPVCKVPQYKIVEIERR
ncbi:MAG: rubredoxin [Gracilibacteraceae bacterium]|jgi:rubredoxin|nr:rubredoxin [Gracilibacteraceae bacterium]